MEKLYATYHHENDKLSDSLTETQSTAIQNKVKIFVINNPRYCFDCSSKCTYRHIQYIQENKKSRQINIAICSKCNKYYIEKILILLI